MGDTRLQRGDRLGALETRVGFKRSELPGWDAVKLTNDQTNAIKHRLGFTFRRAAEGKLSVQEDATVTEPELLLRLDDVHHWVLARAGSPAWCRPAAT